MDVYYEPLEDQNGNSSYVVQRLKLESGARRRARAPRLWGRIASNGQPLDSCEVFVTQLGEIRMKEGVRTCVLGRLSADG
jgi:hypothetical protein